MAKRGAHFVKEPGNKKVTKIAKTRALLRPLRTLSETSVPHLVVFLKYFDTILLGGNGPV